MKTKNKDVHPVSSGNEDCPGILIYDDDDDLLELCMAILAKSKYRVKTLLRCDHVISDIDLIRPQIVLMDLWIPNLGGRKAIEMIRANEGTKYIPIIIFSANNEIEEIFKKTGADDYIRKPFDISVFQMTIEKNLLRVKHQMPAFYS